MSVLLETSAGDIVIDLYTKRAPQSSINFLKLCKLKYFNFCLIDTVIKSFSLQTGDPSGSSTGGQSVWSVINLQKPKLFIPEIHPKLKHNKKGIVSWTTAGTTNSGSLLAGSQFFITLSEDHLDYLDGKHAVFGYIAEGIDVLDKINETIVDDQNRPFRDIRIKHTIVLDDPFDDPEGMIVPECSPEPTEEILKTMRIAEDEELHGDADPDVIEKQKSKEEAAARALTLEMVGDLPFAEIKPPENVLFVCKLNPITRDEDLELIFSRFGTILSCEVVRDKVTGDSLQYAFIEFENKDQCEEAYFKMDNVLIDDRRIHVDFSQSVSKLHMGFLMGKRENIDREEYGGSVGIKKKTQYMKGHHKKNEYELVFEHGGELETEKGTQGSKYKNQSRDNRDYASNKKSKSRSSYENDERNDRSRVRRRSISPSHREHRRERTSNDDYYYRKDKRDYRYKDDDDYNRRRRHYNSSSYRDSERKDRT